MKNARSITELAFIALERSDKYMSAEECLEYLTDTNHFKTFSQQLRELISQANSDDFSDEQIINHLSAKLVEFDSFEGSQIALADKKKIVKKWLKGEIVPDERLPVIKTSFAFGFDLDQTNDLLRKGLCDHHLSIRSAEEAVYMYCLLNHRSYSVANELLCKFNSPIIRRDIDDAINNSQTEEEFFDYLRSIGYGVRVYKTKGNKKGEYLDRPSLKPPGAERFFCLDILGNGYHLNELLNRLMNKKSNNIVSLDDDRSSSSNEEEISELSLNLGSDTTQIMKGALLNSSWENDDLFYTTFLEENKDNFINYSKTALYNYYRVYKDISLNIIKEGISYETLQYRSEILSDNRFYVGRLKAALTSHPDMLTGSESAFPDGSTDITNTTWQAVSKEVDLRFDNNPKEMTAFLREILPTDLLFKEINGDIPYIISSRVSKKGKTITEGNYIPFSNSSLKESIFNDYPISQKLRMIETKPQENIFKKTTRKAIVLFFFINYCLDWFNYQPEKTFKLFYEHLNDDILIPSSLAPLYVADPFDWLILRSIVRYGIAIQYGEEFDPAEHFYEIIRLSFSMSDTETAD